MTRTPFFTELLERVTSIREMDKRNPLEVRTALETLKRYLPDDRHRIRLRELVRETREELVGHIHPDKFPPDTEYADEALIARTERLEALSETSLALTANGCYWGDAEQDAIWIETVRRLAEVDAPQSGKVWALGLYRYPALLHLYAAGVAAVAAGRYHLLASLLLTPVRAVHGGERQAMVRVLFAHDVIETQFAHVLFPHPQTRYKTPLSQYIQQQLRPILADIVPDERDYEELFDRFEYVLSLVHQDKFGFFPGGCFVWRAGIQQRVDEEVASAQDQWGPLQAGLFDSSVERLTAVKAGVDQDSARWRGW